MRNLLFLFILVSCSGIKPIERKSQEVVEDKKVVEVKNEIQEVLVKTVKNVVLQPGKVTFVRFDINLPDGKWEMTCDGNKLDFVVDKNKASVFMAETYFSNLKPFNCKYGEDQILMVSIKSFPYKSEKLNVNKSRVTLSKKDLDRVMKENEIKRKIYLKTASYYLFDKPFKVPLNSFITSYYGNRRLFNNKKKSQHLGNDFRAKVGVKIPVSNKGKVVYAGNLFFTGNVVVVDHGLNIFTAYGHLSKILVSEGMILNQGDIVGLSGATGRVSGPHLHWGVKINGNWVDGFSLVEESKKMQ